MKVAVTKEKERISIISFLLRLALVGVAVYLLVAFVGGQMQVSQKKAQLAELETKVALVCEQNAELELLMSADDEDAYIERVAREKLGYTRPEERIFVDISGQ